MRRTAFTLIEVIIGITLGGFLMGLLISSLFQFIRSAEYVEIATDTTIQQATAMTTLERDISGMFIPQHVMQMLDQALAEALKEGEEKAPQKGPQQPKQKPLKPEQGEEEEEDKAFELPAFICKTERNKQSITRFEFLTNNSPSGFWSAQVGTPQTKVAYVSYWLEPKKENGQLFDLIRSKQVVEFKKKKKGGSKKAAATVVGDIIATNVVEFDAEFINALPSDDPEKPPKVRRQDQLTMQPEKMLKQIKKDPESIPPHLFIDAVKITLTIENQRGTQQQVSQLITVGSQPLLEPPQEGPPGTKEKPKEQKKEDKTGITE